MLTILTNLVYLLALILVSPIALYRRIRFGRYRDGWGNRFGRIERKNKDRKCIWIHAVSVGEVNAIVTVVRELEKRFPNYEPVISTTTDTGYARAKSLLGEKHTVFYFPLDLSWVMKRVFMNIDPAACILVELEVWPNLCRTAEEKKIPVIVINGRISQRSFSRYKIIGWFVKRIFEKLTLVLSQTEEYAERFKGLGCPAERVIVTGSLKYDTAQIADKVDGSDQLGAELNIGKEMFWVAGGTGVDEEKIILDVYKRLKDEKVSGNLRLAIVPRKPERFDEVAELIKQYGFELTRYSQVKGKKDTKVKSDTVILGDTMGDLRKFYSLAGVIFAGRSLVQMGGSDMMEAAALGKCTIFGPYTFNFKQTVDDLLAGDGAIMVNDREGLIQAIRKCLDEPNLAKRIAVNGQNIIRKNQGATQKSIEKIAKILQP